MRKVRLPLPIPVKMINKFTAKEKKRKILKTYGFPAQGSRSDFCKNGKRKLKNLHLDINP